MAIKVLHLIDSSGFYGAENVIVTLCRHAKDTTFEPILGCIVAREADLPEVGVVAKNLSIRVVPVFQSMKFDWWNLRKVISTQDINIIHCHGYKPSVLSFLAERMSGKRIIITCHLWTDETLRLKIYAFLESLIMRRVKFVVAVSNTIKTTILKKGVRRNDIDVIFNGIDLEKWQPIENFNKLHYKKKIGLKNDTLVLGLFGRLNEQKGHKYLFEATANLNEEGIEVICVGDGPLVQDLKSLRKQLMLDDSVHLLGYRDDVRELLEITDIFLMPSLDEGLPMALLEAMAMRKPVVVTPVGAIPSVVSDRIDGILVPTGKVEELEEAILHLIKDSTLRDYLGKNAREKIVKQFSGDVMATKYLEKYRAMITEI